MRLKENSSNWTASGLKRRDFRHVKTGPEVVGGPKVKKNLNKFCNGDTSMPHVVNAVFASDFGQSKNQSVEVVCQNCKAHLLAQRSGQFYGEEDSYYDFAFARLFGRDVKSGYKVNVYMYDGPVRLKVASRWHLDSKARSERAEYYRKFNEQLVKDKEAARA